MHYTCPNNYNVCMSDGFCYDNDGNKNTSYRNRIFSCGPIWSSRNTVAYEMMNNLTISFCRKSETDIELFTNVNINDPRIGEDVRKRLQLKWAGIETHGFTAEEINSAIDNKLLLRGTSVGPSSTFEQHHDAVIIRVKRAISDLLKSSHKGGTKRKVRRNTKRKVRRNTKRKVRRNTKRKSY